MMTRKVNLLAFVSPLLLLGGVDGLECYVCKNQAGNSEKCVSTIKTCGNGEDTCLTEVRWKRAEKQFYVSKKCSNLINCENRRRRLIGHCHHIWYEDWKCASCCQGDRCNYHVTLGGSSLNSSRLLVILTISLAARLIIICSQRSDLFS